MKNVSPSAIFIFLTIILGHYAIRFIPRENGVHYIHLTLNGYHIRNSPFRVIVGTADPDPGLVLARGEGLVSGQTGNIYCTGNISK